MSKINKLSKVGELSTADLIAIFSSALGADAAVTVTTLLELIEANIPALSDILPISNGGTGTSTPGLVAGTNVTIDGAWPNQTINSSGGGGGGGGGTWGSIIGTLSNQTDL